MKNDRASSLLPSFRFFAEELYKLSVRCVLATFWWLKKETQHAYHLKQKNNTQMNGCARTINSKCNQFEYIQLRAVWSAYYLSAHLNFVQLNRMLGCVEWNASVNLNDFLYLNKQLNSKEFERVRACARARARNLIKLRTDVDGRLLIHATVNFFPNSFSHFLFGFCFVYFDFRSIIIIISAFRANIIRKMYLFIYIWAGNCARVCEC